MKEVNELGEKERENAVWALGPTRSRLIWTLYQRGANCIIHPSYSLAKKQAVAIWSSMQTFPVG